MSEGGYEAWEAIVISGSHVHSTNPTGGMEIGLVFPARARSFD